MSKKRGGSSRTRAREAAVQILYAIDVASTREPVEPPANERAESLPRKRDLKPPPDPTPIPTADQVEAEVVDHFEIPPGAKLFAVELVRAVREHQAAIDEIIAEHAQNWRLDRMATLDRNILRLATYELAHTDTPSAVVLDEAVDLARRFSQDPSPAFVNGILDAIATGLREV